jgi:hypothetical protein
VRLRGRGIAGLVDELYANSCQLVVPLPAQVRSLVPHEGGNTRLPQEVLPRHWNVFALHDTETGLRTVES